MRRTVAIKPEARRRIYWTMVSIDTLVSIGATSASSLERFVANVINTGVIFGEPIRTSNCALPWSGASSCYGVLPRKDHHGERAPPRRQCGARIDVDGTSFAAREHRNFPRSATTVATA